MFSNKPSLCILQAPVQCRLLCEASLTTSRRVNPSPLCFHKTLVKLLLQHSLLLFTWLFLLLLNRPCASGGWDPVLFTFWFQILGPVRGTVDVLNICLSTKPRKRLQWQTKGCHLWLCLVFYQQASRRQSGQQAHQTCKWLKHWEYAS